MKRNWFVSNLVRASMVSKHKRCNGAFDFGCYKIIANNAHYLLSLAINLLELALAISVVSFGSSQILFLPHLRTLAAKRF